MKNAHLRNPHRSQANHKTKGNYTEWQEKQIPYMKYYLKDISTYNSTRFYKANSSFQRLFTKSTSNILYKSWTNWFIKFINYNVIDASHHKYIFFNVCVCLCILYERGFPHNIPSLIQNTQIYTLQGKKTLKKALVIIISYF